VQIDRRCRGQRRRQDQHDRVPRVAGIAVVAVDAARLRRVGRRHVELDVQADRIEDRERGRSRVGPVLGKADAIPDAVVARRDHGGVGLRLELRIVAAGDDAIGRRRADAGIELLDDQRHRGGARGHRREQRDERSQPACEDER
jgi:hypothetical protein